VDAYQRTLDWLYSLEKSKGIELKLERVRQALVELGDPQRALRCFHVAGTNGKGSVVAFLAAVLERAGHRVGIYTSPHLVDLTERIRVGAREVERSEIVALAEEVRDRVLVRGIDLTFFEVLTAMGLLHFARAEVDYAILEVGLGGRLDATNVIDPIAAVITSIGIDHTAFLGASLREIAVEKAGIVKPGRPVVVGALAEPAASVIEEIAGARGAPIFRAGCEYSWHPCGRDRLRFSGLDWELDDVEVGLSGLHQLANAATSIATLATVAAQVAFDETTLRAGLRDARWPGRYETVHESPRMILDGAHNLDAMKALVAELARDVAHRPLRVLFAAMGDKDWPAMIGVLGPCCASAVVTEVIPERSAPLDRLREEFARFCPTTVERDPALAFDRLRAETSPGDVVIVTGSLFLVGRIHQHLRDSARTGAVQ
jgi:dihydrofolate synthase/folylpolyglutamate synthase